MVKINIARESDKGNNTAITLILLVTCLIGGFGGIPIGAILNIFMIILLRQETPAVTYGSFATGIIICAFIAFFYVRKEMDTTDYTVCEKCGH